MTATKTSIVCTLLFVLCLLPTALAATATITQSGADSGTVMKGNTFTLTVSGLSGSGTATVTVPSGFSLSEQSSKSFSGSSVSWTTFVANEKLTSQTLSVLISIAGSPSTATTNSFNVVLAPALSATASPASETATNGETFDVSVSVQNTGETTAQNVIATLSLPSGLSTSDDASQTIGSINAGSSAGVSWQVTASSFTTTKTITITVTSSNVDTESDTLSVTCPTCTDEEEGGTGGGGGGAAVPSNATNATTNVTNATQMTPLPSVLEQVQQAPGFMASLESVLGSIDEQKVAVLRENAAAAAGELETRRTAEFAEGLTLFTTAIHNKGTRTLYTVIMHDTIPKTVAEHASMVQVSTEGQVVIANTDPEYVIAFAELAPNEQKSYTFAVAGDKRDLLNDIQSELLIGQLGEAAVPPGKVVTTEGGTAKVVGTWGLYILIALAIIIGMISFIYARKKHL
ncbi:MAG: NEW3 domain-containing protein [archaeon]